jgi:hypothetical protein
MINSENFDLPREWRDFHAGTPMVRGCGRRKAGRSRMMVHHSRVHPSEFQPVKITVWRASSPRASPAIALPVIGLAVSAMMLGASATSVTFADSALAAVAGLRVLADGRGLGRCRRFRLRRRNRRGRRRLGLAALVRCTLLGALDGPLSVPPRENADMRGTVRPSALAVLRFTAISNLVGNCTGRSPGFSPRRMRST